MEQIKQLFLVIGVLASLLAILEIVFLPAILRIYKENKRLKAENQELQEYSDAMSKHAETLKEMVDEAIQMNQEKITMMKQMRLEMEGMLEDGAAAKVEETSAKSMEEKLLN